MKLTGGSMRGRTVKAEGMGTTTAHGALRATSSRVRESVFNIIGPSIDGAIFVDLYSGTGTMGMEAMSRGASKVYYIESDRTRFDKVTTTLDGCGCHAKAVIRNMRAVDFVGQLSDKSSAVDVFFLDPPYESDELALVMPAIGESDVLAEGGVVLCEHDSKLVMPDAFGGLTKARTYKYGDTVITKYIREDT